MRKRAHDNENTENKNDSMYKANKNEVTVRSWVSIVVISPFYLILLSSLELLSS